MAERRRGRGEGSIYRRKDGRWVGQYEVGGKRRYVYGKTRKEVAAKLVKTVADGNDGLIFDSENLTLARYLDLWLDSIRGTVRESTWVRHEISVRVQLRPGLGRARLDKLNPLEIQSFYRRKLDEGQSAASVLKIHSTLSKSLKQAVRWRLIPLNPCAAVMPPRPMKPEIRPLDARQMKTLLKAAEETDLYALWALMATTGVRVGETLGLRWDDLDLGARTLRINRTVYRGQGSQPKTSSGRRTIKLSKLATEALRQHRRTSEWVFATNKGTTINPNNLRFRSWKRLLNDAGLPSGTRMHDLRHMRLHLDTLQELGRNVPEPVPPRTAANVAFEPGQEINKLQGEEAARFIAQVENLASQVAGQGVDIAFDVTEKGAPSGIDLAVLTRRQREVLEMAAQGLSRAQIAQDLHWSVNIVNRHMRDAVRALHAASTLDEATLKALRRVTPH